MSAPDKPRLKVIGGRPVPLIVEPHVETQLERARRRFGRPFAHETGSDYRTRPAPYVLDSWLRGRGK